MDVAINCTKKVTGDDWQITCKLLPFSQRAKTEFGACVLATIILEKETETLLFLEKKYGIDPKHTIILDYIQRHDDCDREKKVRDMTGLLLCGLLRKLDLTTKSVYLFALHPKLIKHYNQFGFTSIDQDDPRNMLAGIDQLTRACTARNISLVDLE